LPDLLREFADFLDSEGIGQAANNKQDSVIEESTCKFCLAKVFLVKTQSNKSMPLDLKPINWSEYLDIKDLNKLWKVLPKRGRMHAVRPGGPYGRAYTCHIETCGTGEKPAHRALRRRWEANKKVVSNREEEMTSNLQNIAKRLANPNP